MATRTANAHWDGSITEGRGTMALGSGAYEGPYSFQSRMEDGPGTNPEELIGAAHAGCFSMQLSAELSQRGTPPESVQTDARVHFVRQGEGFTISAIDLATRARVPGIEEDAFQQAARSAKDNCPVARALAGVEISLDAKLES